MDVFADTTSALIDHDACINQRGLYAATGAQDVSLRATDDLKVLDLAGALAASLQSAGIGAGVDVEVLHQTTTADIGDRVAIDAGGDVTVQALATGNQLAVAANIGFSNSSATVGGAVVVLVDINTTRASIGASADVSAAGSVVVESLQDTTISAIAGNAGVATSSTAVGVSDTTVVHQDTVEALIGSGAHVTANGTQPALPVYTGQKDSAGNRTTQNVTGLVVSATSFEDLTTIAAGFSGGSSVGIGGSVTVNDLTEDTHAVIGSGARINQDLAGSSLTGQGVLVRATDDTDLLSIAGAAQYGGTGGIGGGVDVGIITKDTRAYMEDGAMVKARDDVSVDAESDQTVFSVGANAGAGGFAVALSASIYVVNVGTRAYIGAGATVQAGGDIAVTADDTARLTKIAGAVAIGTSSTVSGCPTPRWCTTRRWRHSSVRAPP